MMRSSTSTAASSGAAPRRIASTARKEPHTPMTSSPKPVATAAPWTGSTYSPWPMMGESPTRPGTLKAEPLVEQAPASWPPASRASTPTVSWVPPGYRPVRPGPAFPRDSPGVDKQPGRCAGRRRVRQATLPRRPRLVGQQVGRLHALEFGKPIGPSPANIMCGVFSMTSRAMDTGCMKRARSRPIRSGPAQA